MKANGYVRLEDANNATFAVRRMNLKVIRDNETIQTVGDSRYQDIC